jgi:5-methylcytosine-specific restriction enzyme subunit McrC
VLHNQIIKATGRRLVRTAGMPTATAESLTNLNRRLTDVADIEVTNRVFGQVQLHRNNQFYDFLLKVCELIHANMLVAERSGPSKFMDFVRDQRQMRYLFEAFVRNFYRVHTSYRVKREDIHWRWIATDKVAAGLLPKMQTDISLMSDTRKIIIDCKFQPEATQTHYEAETLLSAHLFQIFAYLENQPDERFRHSCEAMLLYPTVNNALTASYTDHGRVITIRTINLNQPWQGIHKDLLALVA